MIESALAERQLAPAEQFALGRFYFLAGAVEAVKKQDHVEAAAWYSKALPYLTSPAAQPHGGLATGRLGEWFVSMGVTLWEVGDKPKAVELTERGAELVQQAVDQGIMKKSAVSVPYSNLATMHEALGNQDKASSFGQLAKAAETAAADIKRR
jgi:TPR repeat protein